MRVLINNCYGGFDISEAAGLRLRELGMKVDIRVEEFTFEHEVDPDYRHVRDVDVTLPQDVERHDVRLLQVFDEMGQGMKAVGCSGGGHLDQRGLKAVEVVGDRYRITEYDGWERVETPDSIEWVLAS